MEQLVVGLGPMTATIVDNLATSPESANNKGLLHHGGGGGGGGHHRGRGRGSYSQYGRYQEQPHEHRYYSPGPPDTSGYPQRPAAGAPQVAAVAHYDHYQGNW